MTFANLSDEQLLNGLATICAKTNELLARLIAYLVEVEKRGLHERAAYCSMYDFCKRRLGLSNGATFRRLTASRLAQSFPIILERIERGELSLEALVALRDHLTEANVVELLDAVAHKTTQQVETLVAARFPRPDSLETIRAFPSSAQPDMKGGITENLLTGENVLAVSMTNGSSGALGTARTRPTDVAPAAPSSSPPRWRIKALSADSHEVKVIVSTELKEEIERVQDLMRHRNRGGDLELILTEAIRALRQKLEKEVRGKTSRPLAKARPCKPGRVPTATKRAVFERDGEQCTYADEAGNRCPAKTLLEIHHIRSKARGGTEELENLCVRCQAHNLMAARDELGRAHVQRAIDIRRRKSVARAKARGCAPRRAPQYRTPSAR